MPMLRKAIIQDVKSIHAILTNYADCLKCPKFPDCDEIAMILKL
ncbi:unnamed protein product [marine sediment metagenome]|uniref:N-acetyltransferase domain-containing protein n=1 Tax=marine sediment metagenome TaxID=412755 RepID=X1R679_9ZZZZ